MARLTSATCAGVVGAIASAAVITSTSAGTTPRRWARVGGTSPGRRKGPSTRLPVS
ncbi:hypothetical protein RDV89_00495 [Nocardioides zeae]|uniref:Secreted protein n=1 Tax=Nocardioides imazamoxiresistens TaxID=3231893 RepID=A0ABU3PQN8_9ACTN|nr:hypothetical protein [Nocardioides zeae]MDT9591524.1 hypothetical protein [Nocardioides zeae]